MNRFLNASKHVNSSTIARVFKIFNVNQCCLRGSFKETELVQKGCRLLSCRNAFVGNPDHESQQVSKELCSRKYKGYDGGLISFLNLIMHGYPETIDKCGVKSVNGFSIIRSPGNDRSINRNLLDCSSTLTSRTKRFYATYNNADDKGMKTSKDELVISNKVRTSNFNKELVRDFQVDSQSLVEKETLAETWERLRIEEKQQSPVKPYDEKQENNLKKADFINERISKVSNSKKLSDIDRIEEANYGSHANPMHKYLNIKGYRKPEKMKLPREAWVQTNVKNINVNERNSASVIPPNAEKNNSLPKQNASIWIPERSGKQSANGISSELKNVVMKSNSSDNEKHKRHELNISRRIVKNDLENSKLHVNTTSKNVRSERQPESWMLKKPLIDMEALLHKRGYISKLPEEKQMTIKTMETVAVPYKHNNSMPASKIIKNDLTERRPQTILENDSDRAQRALDDVTDNNKRERPKGRHNYPVVPVSLRQNSLFYGLQQSLVTNTMKTEKDYHGFSGNITYKLGTHFDPGVDQGLLEKMQHASLEAAKKQLASGQNVDAIQLIKDSAQPKLQSYKDMVAEKPIKENDESRQLQTDRKSSKSKWMQYCLPSQSSKVGVRSNNKKAFPEKKLEEESLFEKIKNLTAKQRVIEQENLKPRALPFLPENFETTSTNQSKNQYDREMQQKIYQRNQLLNMPKIEVNYSKNFQKKSNKKNESNGSEQNSDNLQSNQTDNAASSSAEISCTASSTARPFVSSDWQEFISNTKGGCGMKKPAKRLIRSRQEENVRYDSLYC